MSKFYSERPRWQELAFFSFLAGLLLGVTVIGSALAIGFGPWWLTLIFAAGLAVILWVWIGLVQRFRAVHGGR